MQDTPGALPPEAGQQPPQQQDGSVQGTDDLISNVAAAVAGHAAEIQTLQTQLAGARKAFGDLNSKVQEMALSQAAPSGSDDQQARLVDFLGYKPLPEQQVELFKAFAAWHATKPHLAENRFAGYRTKKGDLVEYGYADLAAVIAAGQLAAAFGLAAITRQELSDSGDPVITAYLIHANGGAVSGGPVPLFPGSSDRSPGQSHSAGLTTARRLALQMVLGLAADRDDDFNEESSRRDEGGRPQPQGNPSPATRPAPVAQRPPGPQAAPRTVGQPQRTVDVTRTAPAPGQQQSDPSCPT